MKSQIRLTIESILFVIMLFILPGKAAQLIDTFPAPLANNWEHCLHFIEKDKQCDKFDVNASQSPRIKEKPTFQSYTKNIIVSSEFKKQTISLSLNNIDEVDEVYFNNNLIGRTGKFNPDFEGAFRFERIYLIPKEIIYFNQFNQIKIKTHSSRNLKGLMTTPPQIGNYLTFIQEQKTTNYIYIACIAIFMTLVVLQFFYFIVVKNNYEALFFTLFLFGLAIFTFTRSQLVVDWGLDLSAAFKLESIMMSFSIVAGLTFLFRFFELEIDRASVFSLFLVGGLGLTLIIWPDPMSLRSLAEINYLSIFILGAFVSTRAIIMANRRERNYTILVGGITLISWLVVGYDLLMHTAHLLDRSLPVNKLILPVFATFVSLTFSLIITHNYWRFFKGNTFDNLTGTLLRPAFYQRLSEEMIRSQHKKEILILAIIDIVEVKNVSANFGQNKANQMICSVSNSISSVIRPFDLICRFSEDQFSIAASFKNKQQAEKCLEDIYNSVQSAEDPIEKTAKVYFNGRVGGVLLNEALHLTVSHLVQDANYALSKAKNKSKSKFLLVQDLLIGD